MHGVIGLSWNVVVFIFNALINLWNGIVPIFAGAVYIMIPLFLCPVFFLAMIVYLVALVMTQWLETAVDWSVSRAATHWKRRALVAAIRDPATWLHVPRGPPAAVSRDVIGLIDAHLTVKFSSRRFLQKRAPWLL